MAGQLNILKALGVRTDERFMIKLMILYSFALGLATAFFYTPATSLFLQHFSRRDIPAGYILGGFFVFVLGRIVKRLQRRLTQGALFRWLLTFLLLSTSVLVAVYFLVPIVTKVMVFVLFGWIRIYLYILAVSFWGLANRLFTSRQGKRLFSLVGAGEVLSFIISFASIPFLLKLDHVFTSHLLVLSLFGLLASLFVGSYIIAKNKEKLKSKGNKKGKKEAKAEDQGAKTTKGYFRLMYAMSVFPILAVVFVEFLFFAQSQKIYEGQGESLSGFLALFFGLTAIVEFVVKTFISGRLIDRFGLKLGLLALPGMLAFSFFLVSVSGFFPLVLFAFFPALAFSRLFLRAMRTSFYEPSFQVLFQPIPEADRLAFQNSIEGSVKSYGNMLAGFIVWGLMAIKSLELRHIACVFLALALVWLWVTLRLHKSYIFNLKRLLFATAKQTKQDADEQVVEPMEHNDIAFRLYYLKDTDYVMFESEMFLYYPSVDDKLHPVFLKCVHEHIDTNGLEMLKGKLPSEDLVELEWMLTLPIAYWETTGKIGTSVEQRIAANMLGASKRYSAYKPLITLMRNDNPFVAKASVRAAGKLKRNEVWPFLFEALKNPVIALSVVDSIFRQKKSVVPDLVEFLQKNSLPNELLRIIIPRLVKYKSDAVLRFLQVLIVEEDYRLRNCVLLALATMDYAVTKTDRTRIYILLEEEVKDIVRLAHIYEDVNKCGFSELRICLLEDIQKKKDNIFLLLSVLYDANVVRMIREKMEQNSQDAKSFAVEILDITVEEDIKLLVLPALENEEPEMMVQRYRTVYYSDSRSCFERLKELVNLGFYRIGRHTRLYVISLIGSRYREEGDFVLRSILYHPRPIFSNHARVMLTDDIQGEAGRYSMLLEMTKTAPYSSLTFDDLVDLYEKGESFRGNYFSDYRENFLVVLEGSFELDGKLIEKGVPIFIESIKPLEIDTHDALAFILPTHELFVVLGLYADALSEWERNAQVIELDNTVVWF